MRLLPFWLAVAGLVLAQSGDKPSLNFGDAEKVMFTYKPTPPLSLYITGSKGIIDSALVSILLPDLPKVKDESTSASVLLGSGDAWQWDKVLDKETTWGFMVDGKTYTINGRRLAEAVKKHGKLRE